MGFEAVWGMTLGQDRAAVIEVAAALDTGDGANGCGGRRAAGATQLIQAIAGSSERPAAPRIKRPMDDNP